jgi:hypothetical protein
MPGPLTVRKDGFVLESVWRPGDWLRVWFAKDADPPPGGMLLDRAELVPAAADVFTPDELDERIEALSRKLLPGFAEARGEVACWACARAAPSRSSVTLWARGWRCRVVACIGVALREVYCPECFSRWGWPDRGRVIE